VDSSGTAKICDFGLARLISESKATGLTTATEHIGTVRYLSYELVIDEDHNTPTTMSDVHALGCIGLEVISSVILIVSLMSWAVLLR
jgi:serine/threonine protein kinase